MKPAVLIIYKKRQIIRVMWFSNHHQAIDVAQQFKAAGFVWSLHPVETYYTGGIPIDMPEKQLKLFGYSDFSVDQMCVQVNTYSDLVVDKESYPSYNQ